MIYKLKIFVIISLILSSSCQDLKKDEKLGKQFKLDEEYGCKCLTSPGYGRIVNCDTSFFDDGGFIFWDLNCDSAWLTLHNSKSHEFQIAMMEKSYMDLTGRVGKDFVKDYSQYILIQHRWISGCCMPTEYQLFDKVTGDSIFGVKPELMIQFDWDNNVLCYFSNEDLKEIVVYDLVEDKRKLMNISRYNLDSILKQSYFPAENINYNFEKQQLEYHTFEKDRFKRNVITVK